MCIKWGYSTSSYFRVLDDVRQGDILFPRLFTFYVYDLSTQLSSAIAGCFIEHQCVTM